MYPLIDLQGVTKTYPNGVCALDGVDLHIEKGEFVFVVGHSGAGKSTLIKTLLREEVPTEGEVTVNGRDLIHMKQREIPYFRRTIGVVFQDFRLIPTMTVFDNVAFALQVTGVPRRFIRRRVPYILNLLGLDDKYKHYPPELSGGEQQRVALARALVNNPDLLIADEPTGNIDPELSYEIVELLDEINKTGTTILMVTHEHELVNRFHHRTVTLEKGRIIRDQGGASIGVLIACMVLIGGALLLSFNINSLMGYVESFNEVVVWIDDDLGSAGTERLKAEIDDLPNIASKQYISKEDALKELSDTLGSQSFLEGFEQYADENPLPASFRLKVNSLENLPETVKTLESLSGVESVESSNEVATTLVGIKTAIHVAGLTIVAILMVVSIIIIANTVRVTIFNRRREINIMKYVGATNAFIRFPFLVEGMVIGLISALIAFGLLWVGTHFLYQWVGQSASGWLQLAYQSLIPFVSIAPQMLLGFVAAGVLFGMVGSFIFVGKYLKV